MTGKDGGWVLPDNLHPPTVCFQIEVPNDRMYIAAFMGALWELQYWFNWKRDPAHTALEVSDVWRPLLENIKYCDGTPVNRGYAGAGGGDDDPMIRQNPDNPCELQNSVDGVTWCTWADLSLCFGSNQPGSGAEQPHPGGGEVCYQARLFANGTWLVPTKVSTGDVITISSTGGAATGDGVTWQCPDGNLFVAGFCVGGTIGYDAGNPVPLAPEMSIIVNIAGTFYQITDGVDFTVPGGVSNAPFFFQVNDDDLTDNNGDYSFKVCVTNNAAEAWSHTLLFAASPQGFGITPYNPGVDAGTHYVLGSGWESGQTKSNDGSPTPRYTVDNIVFDWLTSTTLLSVVAKMNTTLGTNAGGSTFGQAIQKRVGGTQTTLASVTPSNGSNQTIAWTGSTPATGLSLSGFISDAGGGGTGTGSMVWIELQVSGSGFDPWA